MAERSRVNRNQLIQLFENTSHVLELCEYKVNKVFWENVQNVLDVLLYSNQFTQANIAMKIKHTAATFRALNYKHVIEIFDPPRLLPLKKSK